MDTRHACNDDNNDYRISMLDIDYFEKVKPPPKVMVLV